MPACVRFDGMNIILRNEYFFYFFLFFLFALCRFVCYSLIGGDMMTQEQIDKLADLIVKEIITKEEAEQIIEDYHNKQ